MGQANLKWLRPRFRDNIWDAAFAACKKESGAFALCLARIERAERERLAILRDCELWPVEG